jgi:photosystem II stability/assembly factor-like uncharacterized protein
VDRNNSSVIYAGLLSDKEFGGVFVSRDAGQSWQQKSNGLDGRDVFVLRQANDNSLLAGTDRGIFQLKPGASAWLARTAASIGKTDAPANRQSGRTSTAAELNTRITALEVAGGQWFAATANGLFSSSDSGETWRKEALPGVATPASISVAGKMIAVAGRNTITVSVNGGESWLPCKPFDSDFVIHSVAVSGAGDIWLATRNGLYRSTDAGDSWKQITTLRLADIRSIQLDEENHRMLVLSGASTNIFESVDNGRTWSAISTGWSLRNLRLTHGRLLGTTAFDGVVIQPEATAAVEAMTGSGSR